jgi:hypothetical protein
MNNLQVRQLKIFCKKHELDTALIDSTLTYSENKDYLRSQITDFGDRLAERWSARQEEWDSAEEDYFVNHFLMYYLFCVKDGSNKSQDVGPVLQTTPEFSLRNMQPIQRQEFSLKSLLPTQT